MLESVDQSVGRITAKLEELGIARDTLVVVTSDNGAVEETPDTGQRITRNAPLRGGKATLYEGGLRVPLLVRWPAVVAAGRETDVPTVTTDWFPTLLDVAGAGEGDRGRDRSTATRSTASASCRCCARTTRASSVRSTSTTRTTSPATVPTRLARPGGTHPARRCAPAPSSSFVASMAPPSSTTWRAIQARPTTSPPIVPPTCADSKTTWGAGSNRKARTCRGPTPPTTPAPSLAASPIRWRLWAALRSGRPTAAAPNRLAGGKLELDCVETPFIIGPELVVSGPLRVAVRFTSSETRGGPLLWYRSASKPQFDGDRIVLDAAAESGVYEGRIERDETVRQLRIDFGRNKGGRVAIDWVRLYDPANDSAPLAQWSFDAAEARPRSASPVSSDQPLD